MKTAGHYYPAPEVADTPAELRAYYRGVDDHEADRLTHRHQENRDR